MFDTPEYASYIALCRELRLEREIEEGDITVCFEAVGGWGGPSWVPAPYPVIDIWTSNVKGYRSGQPEPDRGPPSGWTWLPRLDQWLAMLEEAGRTRVRFYQMLDGTWAVAADDGGFGRLDEVEEIGRNPTREEACARLWCAVTGRTVTT